MAVITLSGFVGSNSAVDPRLLSEQVGTRVVDAEPGRGDLRPLKAATNVATVPSSPQRLTIARMGRGTASDSNYWLSASTVCNFVLGQESGDTTERTYFSGSGTPKWTDNVMGLGGGPPYPQASRELAVPAPLTAPTLVLTTDGTATESVRFYVYTYVNDLGWESAPSPLSAGLTAKDGATVAISGMSLAPAGNYGIDRIRIYRTQAGSDGANYYFLREIAIGTTSTDDGRALDGAIATIGWLPPDATGFGLTGMWNGMYALITGDGKTVTFCEPYAPYAWPVKYDISTRDKAVALGVWGQSLLVLTNGAPRLITGSSPDGLDDSGLPMVQPCLSARGVVSMGHGVVWPSAEGLAYAGDSGQMVLTNGILTETQWRALVPSSMIAGRYGKWYVCSYNDGAGRKGFMIDPLNPAGGIWYLSYGWDACYYDELQDALYILNGAQIKKFDAGSAGSATFTSKVFVQQAPTNFGYCKVIAAGYPVTVKISSDAAGTMTTRMTKTVTNREPFTLPSGFRSEEWQFEVTSAYHVQAVRVATSVQELKGA